MPRPARSIFDRAIDVALLRQLARAGRRWHGSELIRDAIVFAGYGGRNSQEPLLMSAVANSLSAMRHAGIVERRKAEFGGCEWRLAPDVNLRLITGGIDPTRISQEECMELSQPHVEKARNVQFEPEAYMQGRGVREKLRKALDQCPSLWHYAARIDRIDNLKHATHRATA